MVINSASPFTLPALALIKKWLGSSGLYRAASIAAAEKFTSSHAENMGRWRELEREILGSGAASCPAVTLGDPPSNT